MKRSLFVIMVITAVSISAQAKYSGGSGTSEAPYQIASTEDLLALAADTNDYDANFVLTADINLADHHFSTAVIAPDSNSSDVSFNGTEFTGIFDGAGKQIVNMTIDCNGVDHIGLFGDTVVGSEIKNLRLTNFSINAGDNSTCVGGLAGETAGKISNCFSQGNIIGDSNSSNIGGLVGVEVGSDSNIIDSYSVGTITSGNDSNYIGGLVGFLDYNGVISRCFSQSDITGGNNGSYIGGLVGQNYLGHIANCFSTGTLVSEVNYFSVGGLVGENFWGSIENCYSTVNVSADVNKADLGGLVGRDLDYIGVISNSYFLNTSGPDNNNGVPLTDIQMKQQASFAGWDFNSVWQISENLDYPDLAWHFICTPPSAPTGISATDGAYNNHIRVTWNSASGATGYEVWRNTSNDSGTAIKSGDYTSPYDDSNVISGTTYYYWVKATISCGTSDFSSSDSGYASTNQQTVSIIKCTVRAGSKVNSDKISFSGTIGATADDFNDANNSIDANFVEVIIRAANAEDMDPCVFTFPVTSKTFKKGKFKSTISSKPFKASFAFDTNKTKFSFSASNVNLKGLSCPVIVDITVGNYAGTVDVNESIVNGSKKPIPIKFLMGVKNSLRVDRAKFTRNRISDNITQVAVRGGFSVEDLNDANMFTNPFDVNVGSQIFTIPVHSFKAGKNKYTCSKVDTTNGIAYATFDFNRCTFTLTIKNTNFAANAGTADFLVDFASFSGSDEVTLPVILP